jgi:hypothetical protein
VNLLVMFLRDHPEAVGRLADGERVSLEEVIATVRDFEFPVRLDDDVQRGIGQPWDTMLADAYLAVVPAQRWRERLEQAAPSDGPQYRPIEWVTFVPGPGGERGLALPQDSDSRAVRIALFVRLGEGVARVALGYRDFPGGPANVSVESPQGCTLPDYGDCHGGECGGACDLQRVHDDDDGLVCHCPSGW